jgi:4-hydroxy-2-oxoglutarate aldolase
VSAPGSQLELEGVLPALTTPFDGDRVSPQRLQRNLAKYERIGLSGYLVLGSTGEAVLLEPQERRVVLEAAREAIPTEKLMIAGVCAESTREAEGQALEAAECGADLLLVSTPHYFRAEMRHEALREHFLRLADRAPVPLLLYNVPKFTGLVLPVETVVELSGHANVAGIKESSGDLDYLRRIAHGSERGFAIACGNARHLPQARAAGACAAILAAAAAIPEALIACSAAPELHARLLQAGPLPGVDLGVPAIKVAMEIRGLHGGAPRRPLLPLDLETRTQVEESLQNLVSAGLIETLRL